MEQLTAEQERLEKELEQLQQEAMEQRTRQALLEGVDVTQCNMEALVPAQQTAAQTRVEKELDMQRRREEREKQRAEEQAERGMSERGTVDDAAAAANQEVTEEQVYEHYKPSHCRGAIALKLTALAWELLPFTASTSSMGLYTPCRVLIALPAEPGHRTS